MSDPQEYDVIIVGARVAGSVLAYCLAQRGYRVLALDRAGFPSETVSTHIFGRETVARFSRLGLWDRIERIGAPPLPVTRRVAVEEGVDFEARFLPYQGWEAAYSIRRGALDTALLEQARTAGAQVIERATVSGLLHHRGDVAGVEGHLAGGSRFQFRGRVVVGADGRHSHVAGWVRAHAYDQQQPIAPAYYAYYQNVGGPRDRLEFFHSHDRSYQLAPTDAGLSCLAIFLPWDEFEDHKADFESRFSDNITAVPELAERFAGASRVGRLMGASDLESYVRSPYGPGWALVGDAGLCLHPITARGIDFAVRDAENLAEALNQTLSGQRPYGDALDEYRALRDTVSEAEYKHAIASALQVGEELPVSILTLWSALALLPEEGSRFVSNVAGSHEPEALRAAIYKARALVGVDS